jgi:hypothetical protein
MTRKLFPGVLTFLFCLAGTRLGALPAESSSQAAVLSIPAGLSAFPGDTLAVPVFISTAQAVGQAQMVVEFDAKNFSFVAATVGPDAAGFIISQAAIHPAIPVTTPGATENVLLQISGGSRTFSGNDRNVLFLHFRVSGAAGGISPFAFNPDSSATFLTTDSLALLQGTALQFNNGSGSIANLATLSIPGGFSVPQAETLRVPVLLTSPVKSIGVAQVVFDYDGDDLRFLEATPGPDAEGFAMFIDPAPVFAPATAGTNKNLLITLYSGGAAISGTDRTLLTLSFLAAGQAGGNSPIAFDRRPHHTVLATTDLVDLTGADLTFRDGDATILPPVLNVIGKVVYKNSTLPVSGTIVEISGPFNSTGTTDTAGDYLIKKIPQGSYTLRPAKIGDTREAIQGSDVLLVLRASALLDTLTADQKRCADVTQDGLVTVSDALAILRYLALQTTGIAQVGAWVFEPESVPLLIQSDTTQNFAAFLLGDANGNWSQPQGVAKMLALPIASLQFGQLREEGESVYLPLLAGKEGPVFTLLTTFELPPNMNDPLRFVPSESHILSVAHFDMAQKWHLALVTINGIPAEQKIGELVMSRSAAASLRNWRVTRAEVNDRPTKVDGLQLDAGNNSIPDDFVLQPNFPNPFNAATWIVFGIPASAGETEVQLDIFTAEGRQIRALKRGKSTPGTHRVVWDGRDNVGTPAPSGVYFYRIQAGEFTASRKLVVIK